jgi:hypothetical protein
VGVIDSKVAVFVIVVSSWFVAVTGVDCGLVVNVDGGLVSILVVCGVIVSVCNPMLHEIISNMMMKIIPQRNIVFKALLSPF